MRSIPLRTVDVTVFGASKPAPLKYAGLILGVLSQPHHQRGMDLAELARATAIIRIVQKADADGLDAVVLEDADWTYLAARIVDFNGWTLIHEAIVDFADAIKSAPPHDPNMPPA